MNVLLTCVGRRNYIVDYFKQALGSEGKVYAANSYGDAAGMVVADKAFVLPSIYHPGYVSNLLEICQTYDIRLLISLFDLELPIIASNRQKFFDIGTFPLVSSSEVNDLCFDKRKSNEFCSDIGLNIPKSYFSLEETKTAIDNRDVDFPLVIKPRWGTGSIGLEYAFNSPELFVYYDKVKRTIAGTYLMEIIGTDKAKDVIIQEKIEGVHYTVDIINDLEGRYQTCFIKHKIEMRAGEADRAELVSDERITKLCKRIATSLKHIGNLDIDIIIKNNISYVIDLNPRIGGGYPFSHAAGANLPAALIAWIKGEEPKEEWLNIQAGVLAVKGIQMFVVNH